MKTVYLMKVLVFIYIGMDKSPDSFLHTVTAQPKSSDMESWTFGEGPFMMQLRIFSDYRGTNANEMVLVLQLAYMEGMLLTIRWIFTDVKMVESTVNHMLTFIFKRMQMWTTCFACWVRLKIMNNSILYILWTLFFIYFWTPDLGKSWWFS